MKMTYLAFTYMFFVTWQQNGYLHLTELDLADKAFQILNIYNKTVFLNARFEEKVTKPFLSFRFKAFTNRN